jgi:hypothetical protein
VRAFPELDFSTEHGQAQRAVIDKLGTGGRIGLAIGVAGSGKTTLLKPLVRAWQDDGRTVHGVALAWRQSDDLAEAGIEGRTRAVASFLMAVERGRLMLDAKSVVVVDEVGLLGTRQLNDILALQKRTGFQLVMLGDPKQMQSVEAGPVIGLLRHGLSAGAGQLGAAEGRRGTGKDAHVPQRPDGRGRAAQGRQWHVAGGGGRLPGSDPTRGRALARAARRQPGSARFHRDGERTDQY